MQKAINTRTMAKCVTGKRSKCICVSNMNCRFNLPTIDEDVIIVSPPKHTMSHYHDKHTNDAFMQYCRTGLHPSSDTYQVNTTRSGNPTNITDEERRIHQIIESYDDRKALTFLTNKLHELFVKRQNEHNPYVTKPVIYKKRDAQQIREVFKSVDSKKAKLGKNQVTYLEKKRRTEATLAKAAAAREAEAAMRAAAIVCHVKNGELLTDV